MRFLYALAKRIKLYFENNILFFCVFAGLSIASIFILIVSYVINDPYIEAKQSKDIYFKTMNAELFENDKAADLENLLDAAREVGEIADCMFSSFPREKVILTAFSGNNVACELHKSNNAIFKGKSSFTEKESNECAMIAVVGKDSEALPGDTIETPFGSFLVVGKNCSIRQNITIPYGTFQSLVDVPRAISIEFENKIPKENEEKLLQRWRELLPRHPFGNSKYSIIMDESFYNAKIVFAIAVVALVVIMMTLNYFDDQNRAGDIVMRLTGATRFDVTLLSASAKTVVTFVMSLLAIGIYDVLILCGVKEIKFFGQIFPLELRDRIILLTVCLAATLVTVIPMVIQNLIAKPFEIAQRRE